MAQPASAGDVDRIGGADRVDTAIKVFEENRSLFAADRVLIARFDSYADALTATPLGAATKAPVLLTPSGELDDRVLAVLKRQGIKNVGIVGGTSAVSPAVARELEANGMQTMRVAGADRFETSRLIADAILQLTGKSAAPAYVATGINFPDALAAGTAAAHAKGYVLLSRGNSLDDATANYLKSSKASPIVAVGGPAVTAVKSAGINATAITGATRFDTAVKLAELTHRDPSNVVIASGMTYADSLAGGVLAALKGAPLLLTPPNTVDAATAQYLVKVQPDVTILGGTQAVNAGAAAKIDMASDGKMPPLDPSTPAPAPTPSPSPTSPSPTTPTNPGGGGVVTPTPTPVASLQALLDRGAGTYQGASTATSADGKVQVTSTATLTVRSDKTYTLTQQFSGTASGTTGNTTASSSTTLTNGSASIVLKQDYTGNVMGQATASGSGSATLTTVSSPKSATLTVNSVQATSHTGSPQSVSVSVASSLAGTTVNTATASASYSNSTWSQPTVTASAG